VKNNNELKESAVKELKALIYKLEKGKVGPGLDVDITSQIKEAIDGLEYSIGTGNENIVVVANEVKGQIKELKKSLSGDLQNRVESATEELVFSLNLWTDILDGEAEVETDEDMAKAKVSRGRKKLNARLAELDEIKTSFVENDKRIEKEIVGLEKDLAEYEGQILEEDNERKINEIYRKIKAQKSKIDMLTIRRSNYSACYNLLDMIHANAREILNATDFAAEEIAKAKVLLNIAKLKKVVSEPDQAVAILRVMDKDIKDIAARTAKMDEKVFAFDGGNATVNDEALAYKEELMRKKREKENLNKEIIEGKVITEKTETITEEN
jgi:hypothetical protein